MGQSPPKDASRLQWVMVVSTALLGIVLLASVVFAAVASRAVTDALNRSQATRALSRLYVIARYDVAQEESLERKYRLEPGPNVAIDHARVSRELSAALERIVRVGTPRDASEARNVSSLHARYLEATKRMFAAVDRRESARALRIDRIEIDPVFTAISKNIEARAAVQRDATDAAYRDLAREQNDVLGASSILAASALAGLAGYVFVILAYRRDVLRAHTAEMHRIENLTLVDSLTRIGNHRAFKDDIERELSLMKRYGGTLTLALIDIDEFKLINDQNGHVYGDGVLVDLAQLLDGSRDEDRAYRLGGDEFALILPHTSDTEARTLLERIRQRASDSLRGGTVSVGFASVVGAADVDAECLQDRADAALYLAKRGGRNGVSQYDASHEATWLVSTERVLSLRSILAAGTLTVAFQPIWDLDRCEILAYESLARFAASSGFSSAQDAFDLAERLGCAHDLDRATRMAAFARGSELPPSALLFINVSPQTLDRDFDTAAFVAALLPFGLEPARIVIEITERSIAHLDVVIETARELRTAGFGLALDDTGSGNAGLEIMSRLHFDYVKIDRSIIIEAERDRGARGVLAAIVTFARVTGSYVIAEGIETIAMLASIGDVSEAHASHEWGIRGAQGYLLGRPSDVLPSEDEALAVRTLIRRHACVDGEIGRFAKS